MNLIPASSIDFRSDPMAIFAVVSGTRLRRTAIFKPILPEESPRTASKPGAKLVATRAHRQPCSRLPAAELAAEHDLDRAGGEGGEEALERAGLSILVEGAEHGIMGVEDVA